MVNKENDPVEWALFIYELDDATEHLTNLVKALSESSALTEEEFKIHLGHVYSHLNRAWHRRNIKGQLTDEQWKTASQFPKDLEPA